MNIRGYNLTADWKISSIGEIVPATRDGKKYFLKKYGECKKPVKDESISPSLFNDLTNTFNKFKDYRIRINESLKSLAGPGGNIVLPCDWFVHDINYIEATEFIENIIDEKEIYKLKREEIDFIMLTASAALYNIHRKNIVHSDLKLPNLLVARNTSGNLVAKIIDFDRSYFANDIVPDYLGGDQNYMSPELTLGFMRDFDESVLGFLSTKSDIFSLGLIFYNYFTKGKFPETSGLKGALLKAKESGRKIYPGEAMLNGAKLVIGKEIKDLYIKRLLAQMLEFDPTKRISAFDVLQTLRNKTVLDRLPDSCIVIEGESEDKPKVEDKPKKDDKPKVEDKPKEDVKPSVVVKGTDFEMLPEHKLYTFNPEAMERDGYVKAVPCDKNANKGYILTSKSGKEKFFNLDVLKILGYVKFK